MYKEYVCQIYSSPHEKQTNKAMKQTQKSPLLPHHNTVNCLWLAFAMEDPNCPFSLISPRLS